MVGMLNGWGGFYMDGQDGQDFLGEVSFLGLGELGRKAE